MRRAIHTKFPAMQREISECWQNQQTTRVMRKPASQGSGLADKGSFTDVSDRRLQVQLAQEAKIATDFHFIKAIFAVVGFVSAMRLHSHKL